LPVLDIINEPTAAALAFAFESHRRHREKPGSAAGIWPADQTQETTALVYDLGGGTFDVSIVRIGRDRFETLATDGDVRLGGRDWDQRLVEYFAEQFVKLYRCDPRDDPQSLAFLFQEAEHAKHALSARSATRAMVAHDAKRMSIEVNRAQLDRLT